MLNSIVLTDDTRHWQFGHYVTLAGEGKMCGTGNMSFCGQFILTHWQRQDLLPQIILLYSIWIKGKQYRLIRCPSKLEYFSPLSVLGSYIQDD